MKKFCSGILYILLLGLFYSCNHKDDSNYRIRLLEKKIVSDSLKYNTIIESLQDSINKMRISKDSLYIICNKMVEDNFGYRYDVIPACGKLFSHQSLSLPKLGSMPKYKIIEEHSMESQCYFFYYERGLFLSSYSLSDFYSRLEKVCKGSRLSLPIDDENCDDLLAIDSLDGWYSDSKNPNKYVYFIHLSNSIVKQINFIRGSMEFECFTHDDH